MSEIFLFSGEIVLVDEMDLVYLSGWKWCISTKRDDVKYAQRTERFSETGRIIRKSIYIHNMVAHRMGLQGRIDHKNRNGLDNRRENLREATHAQNMVNRKLQSNNTTGYRGVIFRKEKYRMHIQHEYFGPFWTAEQAALAYNLEAIKRFGEFAVLNVIKETK